MKVIARNNGQGLKEGKEYEVICYSEWVGDRWEYRYGDFYNPKEFVFYISVINEFVQKHVYWNNYFLSTEEMRDRKINEILNL